MDFFTFDDEYVRRLREGDRWTEEHFYSYFQQLLLIKLRRRLALDGGDRRRAAGGFRPRFPDFARARRRHSRRPQARRVRQHASATTSSSRTTGRTTAPSRSLDAHLERLTSEEDVEDELINGRGARARPPRHQRVAGTRDARRFSRAIFLEERPKDDVCEEFGVDRGYLRVLLHRAKEKFREAWKKSRRRSDPDETDPAKPSLPN